MLLGLFEYINTLHKMWRIEISAGNSQSNQIKPNLYGICHSLERIRPIRLLGISWSSDGIQTFHGMFLLIFRCLRKEKNRKKREMLIGTRRFECSDCDSPDGKKATKSININKTSSCIEAFDKISINQFMLHICALHAVHQPWTVSMGKVLKRADRKQMRQINQNF